MDTPPGDPTNPDEVRPARRIAPNRKYPWEAVKDHYVQGDYIDETGERIFHNMRELADIHQVPYQKLRNRKSKENWEAERIAFQIRQTKLSSEQKSARLIAELVDFDTKVLASSKVGVMLISARMSEIAEMLKIDREEKAAGIVAALNKISSDWVDTAELSQLARSLAAFQDIGRKCLTDAIDEEAVKAATEAVNPTINIREELAYAPDERIARTFEILADAGLFASREEEDGPSERTDPEAPSG